MTAPMPESIAQLLERTGSQLFADYIVARTSINLNEDVDTLLKGHASLGQTLVGFVTFSRSQGLVVPDEEIEE